MVLIISEDSRSVCDVMDWLSYYNEPFLRINDKDQICTFCSLTLSSSNKIDLKFSINNKVYSLSEIDAVWIRHGFIRFSNMKVFNNLKDKLPELNEFFKSQENTLKSFFTYEIEQKHGLGKIYFQDVNKLFSLKMASLSGLLIPETFIISEKKQLKQLLDEFNVLITKSIQNMFHAKMDGDIYVNYTELITKDILRKIPEKFAPSQFQPLIEKRIEIRTFYLNEKCYSMAVFSQNDKQTMVDYRKYINEKPNRNVPFKLPLDIENKIVKYMKRMNLNTGSLDIIYTPKGEYVFLEMNPVGQFGMVSHPCNYNLEEKIAKHLISYGRN